MKCGEGGVWWRTTETRARCHNRVTAIKMEHFLKSPCFSDRNDTLFEF